MQDYLQMLVKDDAKPALHRLCGIKNGNSPFAAESDNGFVAEYRFGCLFHEMQFVAIEQETHDAPHVVLRIGIEKIHAPPCPRRRETAQQQEFGARRQKGLQRVVFYLRVCGGHTRQCRLIRAVKVLLFCDMCKFGRWIWLGQGINSCVFCGKTYFLQCLFGSFKKK